MEFSTTEKRALYLLLAAAGLIAWVALVFVCFFVRMVNFFATTFTLTNDQFRDKVIAKAKTLP